MSAIASFYLLNETRLNELVAEAATENYYPYLDVNARSHKDFEASGYLYLALLVYLDEERGIAFSKDNYESFETVLTEKRETSHQLIGYTAGQTLLPQLDPSLFSAADLQQFNEELTGEMEEDTGELMLEALLLLHEQLQQLQPGEVLILIIG